MFSNYYSAYVTNLFNKESRNLKIEGRLPLSFLFEYSLADKLLVNGSPFIINEITTDLNTGKSQLDLFTAFDIEEEDLVDVTAPANVTGLASEGTSNETIRIIWDANTESDLAGYKVYVDEVLFAVGGVQLGKLIIGLEANTAYDIKVTAYDLAGNESLLASATEITVTTDNETDTEAPSIPQFLIATLIGSTGITVEWNASTDNVAVTEYKVYLDGVLKTPSSSATSFSFTGLTSNTEYEIRVLAEDAQGNQSAKSTPRLVRTLPS